MKVYQVEVGVLLNENDEEYGSYNIAYDEKYGYYNENLWFCKTYDLAKETALRYVNKGVEKTYAIISDIGEVNDDDFNINEYGNIIDKETGYDLDNEFTNYNLDCVVKAYKKENGIVVEDFVNCKEKKLYV